jgi:hypothetical protein
MVRGGGTLINREKPAQFNVTRPGECKAEYTERKGDQDEGSENTSVWEKAVKSSQNDLSSISPLVRIIIYKWRVFNMTATRPRSGRPSKVSQRATGTIINQLKVNPKDNV